MGIFLSCLLPGYFFMIVSSGSDRMELGNQRFGMESACYKRQLLAEVEFLMLLRLLVGLGAAYGHEISC